MKFSDYAKTETGEDVLGSFVLRSTGNLGNTLSRFEIEAVLNNNGIDFPDSNKVLGIRDSAGSLFRIVYLVDEDVYHYTKYKST